MTFQDHLKEMLGDNPRWVANTVLEFEVGDRHYASAVAINWNFNGIPIRHHPLMNEYHIRLNHVVEERYAEEK